MFDMNLHEFAGSDRFIRFEHDELAQLRASAPAGGVALADAFRENFQCPSDKFIVCTLGGFGKVGKQNLIALFLDGLRNIIGQQLGGFGAFARRI